MSEIKKPTPELILVAARDDKEGIGQMGGLPWQLGGDMSFFRHLTTCGDSERVVSEFRLGPDLSSQHEIPWQELKNGLNLTDLLPQKGFENTVIMGRRTWESIPEKYRPLQDRNNVILSQTINNRTAHPVFVNKMESAMEVAQQCHSQNTFVIGGAQIYTLAFKKKLCKALYLTKVEGDFGTDTFLPEYLSQFKLNRNSPWILEKNIRYRWEEFLLKE